MRRFWAKKWCGISLKRKKCIWIHKSTQCHAKIPKENPIFNQSESHRRKYGNSRRKKYIEKPSFLWSILNLNLRNALHITSHTLFFKLFFLLFFLFDSVFLFAYCFAMPWVCVCYFCFSHFFFAFFIRADAVSKNIRVFIYFVYVRFALVYSIKYTLIVSGLIAFR